MRLGVEVFYTKWEALHGKADLSNVTNVTNVDDKQSQT